MKRNKSFDGTPFYLVATPIGNLKEFSPRAKETLEAVDFICVEDTRTSGLLLSQFGIKKPLLSVHKFNEKSKIELVLSKLQNGEKGAFLSDAGYPLISDPGNPLVSALIESGYKVSVINGPSALLPALIGSGLDTSRFMFIGFLHGNQKEMMETLSTYKDIKETLIFYEAPHRVNKTISTIYDVFAERKLIVARELSKLHEEYIYTTLEEFSSSPITDLKGEIVLVVEGNSRVSENNMEAHLASVLRLMKEKDYSAKEAISIIALLYKVSKNELYQAYLDHQK